MLSDYKIYARTGVVTMLVVVFIASGCSSLKPGGKILDGFRKKGAKREDVADALDPLGARSGNRLLLDDLAPSQILTTIRTRTRFGSDNRTARVAYNKGQQYYQDAAKIKSADPDGSAHQAVFDKAAAEFRVAAANAPDTEIEEEAVFKEGESRFFSDRYVQANRAFEKLVGNYPGSEYFDRAQQRRYAIALYWIELSKSGSSVAISDAKRPKFGLAAEARRILHRIRIDDPTGKLADDATFSLGNALVSNKQYYEAGDTYEDLRRNYPGSKYLFDAHMLELECRLKSYQGPSYDATPLLKAEELVTSIAQQFPKEAQENLDSLEKQASLVNNQLAQRDFEMGQFYETKGENRAAELYYADVQKNHRNSVFAEQLPERIASVKNGPAVPPQTAKWLVDMFPEDEEAKPVIRTGDNETMFR